jgi:hypothetical protein
MIDIWIGYDAREAVVYAVCEFSLRARTTDPLRIQPIGQPAGMYTRRWHLDDSGRRVDSQDGRPFSTEFAFSRFLVPALMKYQGWAIYCDCDFLFQADVARLWGLRDVRFAVQCVQHRHAPSPGSKMDGRSQAAYPRKNWSSLVLWNCAHPANGALTVDAVNARPGRWLHGFQWLPDAAIGALPVEWNWLSGWSPVDAEPMAVHYTVGGPWFAECQDVPLADRWTSERERMRAADAQSLLRLTVPETAQSAG